MGVGGSWLVGLRRVVGSVTVVAGTAQQHHKGAVVKSFHLACPGEGRLSVDWLAMATLSEFVLGKWVGML